MSGSYVTVKVGKIPGTLKDVLIGDNPDDRTVSSALQAAEVEVGDGFEVRVNSRPANLSDRLANGDRVLVTRKIKGN